MEEMQGLVLIKLTQWSQQTKYIPVVVSGITKSYQGNS